MHDDDALCSAICETLSLVMTTAFFASRIGCIFLQASGKCCGSHDIRTQHALHSCNVMLPAAWHPMCHGGSRRAPLVLLVCLLRMTLALAKDVNFWNAFVSTSSFTSLPRSPTKMRKSFSGHSVSVGSHHFSPPAALGIAGGFFFFSFASFSNAACAHHHILPHPQDFKFEYYQLHSQVPWLFAGSVIFEGAFTEACAFCFPLLWSLTAQPQIA